MIKLKSQTIIEEAEAVEKVELQNAFLSLKKSQRLFYAS